MYARTTRSPVRFSRVTRFMLSSSDCIRRNFGITKTMRKPIITIMTATAAPVAIVHSKPLPAIFVMAHTAVIGALTTNISPIVTTS